MTGIEIDAAIREWGRRHDPGREDCRHCAALGEALFDSKEFGKELMEWIALIQPESYKATLMAIKWAVGIGIEAGKGKGESVWQNLNVKKTPLQ